MPEPQTYKRKITIPIPTDRRSELLERMATRWRDLRTTEAQKRQRASEANEELKAAREELDATSAALGSEQYIEEVDCFDQLRGKEVETVRKDTGEVIERRAATAAELQTGFSFDRSKHDHDEDDDEPATPPAKGARKKKASKGKKK